MDAESLGSPRKKPRIEKDYPPVVSLDGAVESQIDKANGSPKIRTSKEPDEQVIKEIKYGITEFVSPDLLGFSGVLKKRYTDFLVNEILPNGTVVHLSQLKAPKPETSASSRNATQDGIRTLVGQDSQQTGDVRATREPASHIHDGEAATSSTCQTASSLSQGKDQSGNIEQHQAKDRKPQELQSGERQRTLTNPQVGDSSASVQKLGLDKSDSIDFDAPDSLSHHFRPLLPHEHTASVHNGTKSPPKKSFEQPADSTARTRQEYHIRHTDEGWIEFDEQSQRQSHEQDQTFQATNGAEKPTIYASEPSTQSQWQAYADTQKDGVNVKEEDKAVLLSYFPESIVDEIVSLYNRVGNSPHRQRRDYGIVRSGSIDRQLRTQIHKDIRSIFESRLESSTDHDGSMIISAVPRDVSRTPARPGRGGDGNGVQKKGPSSNRNPRGKLGWQELGGEYLHFTLYKENKDTMECISWLSKQLNIGPKGFQFAGTKDRRAVTTQKVSVYRTMINRMIGAGRTLRNAKIGDFEYQIQPLALGELSGNEFTITLRDCIFPSAFPRSSKLQAFSVIQQGISRLREQGFLNYYGLQRFGTFSASTDEVGVQIIRRDYEGAVSEILSFKQELLMLSEDVTVETDKVSKDDKARAKAIHHFQSTGNARQALEIMPRKFSAESCIIRHLSKQSQQCDFQGALNSIPFNLRLMYVHAYQSLVWNVVVSERWKRFGNNVVEGDLVISQEKDRVVGHVNHNEEVDEDGEAIVQPSGEDRAVNPSDKFVRARPVTREEVTSGEFDIFDVVLPTPGFDVQYPANVMAQVYEDFMASDRGGSLKNSDGRDFWKTLKLSGNYRKILARPGKDISFQIETYKDENEQFVKTDLDWMNEQEAKVMSNVNEESRPKRQHQEAGNDQEVEGEKHKETGDTVDRMDDDSDMDDGVLLDSSDPVAKDKIAVILKLQLGSGQYATMALRELMKVGGVKTYKPDFGGGR